MYFGLPVVLGLGIAKVPVAAPAAFVVKAAPALEPVGVTYVETSIQSKNGYILVNGFIILAVKDIDLLLIKGAKATCTTLFPKLVV